MKFLRDNYPEAYDADVDRVVSEVACGSCQAIPHQECHGRDGEERKPHPVRLLEWAYPGAVDEISSDREANDGKR